MLLRSGVDTVARYSRARVPAFLSYIFLHPRCNNVLTGLLPMVTVANQVFSNSRNEDLYRRSMAAAERGFVLPFALIGRRMIHTMREDKKPPEQWKKIEESRPIDELMLDSVVKVFSKSTKYCEDTPWKSLKEQKFSGTGFAISGKKILTNAHVVHGMNNHTVVHVVRHGSQIKYKAKVQKIAHECDLAILEIGSDDFWEGMNPLELGDLPPLYEVVSVVGYLDGGDNICITKGLVLRVETREYDHSDTELLSIQINATIDHGNSGAPVIMDNKVVGVANEFSPSKTIGYAIPTPVIKHFITGVQESAQYAGFGSLDLSYQSIENVQIRNYFKMSPEMTGIMINKINSSSGAHGILRKDDIILAIDGVPIGNDEKVPFQKKVRIDFRHLISMKKPGEKALLQVLRKGIKHEFSISLKPVKPDTTVQKLYDLPSYYIFGGFVFVPFIDDLCEYEILHDAYKKSGKQQLVKISEILPDDINEGYDNLDCLKVEKVNRVKVKNIKHLCELIEKCCTENLRLDLEDDKVMVLNYASAKKATSEILKRHKIKSPISKDIYLPMMVDDPFKDINSINLLPWSVLPSIIASF